MSEQPPGAPIPVPHVRAEDLLRITAPNGESTGWVRLEDFESAQDCAHALRRTLALAHMLMSFGDLPAALRKIETDTGLTIEDARAMRSILSFVDQSPRPQETDSE